MLIVIAVGLVVARTGAADAVVDRARSTLAGGDAQAAYQALAPLQGQRAGDPEFDYVLGLAALDSGRPDEALFALERVVAVQPGNVLARAAMARALTEIGDIESARREFEAVRASGALSGDDLAEYRRYFDRMDRGMLGARTEWRGYVSATLGYDTNVSSSTSDRVVSAPGTTLTLDDTQVGDDDVFLSAAAGGSVVHPLTPALDLVGDANLFQRMNASVDDLEVGGIGANVGLRWRTGLETITGTLVAERLAVDHDTYRDATGGDVRWQHRLPGRGALSAYLRITELDYETQASRDATRYAGGASYIHYFAGTRFPVGVVSLYGGDNDQHAEASPEHGYEFWGVRVAGQLEWSSELRLFASAGYERREHDGPHPTFGVTRDDDRYELRIGGRYIPAEQWSITPSVSFTRSDSNILVNDFDRTVIAVTVRRDFY